MRLEVLNPNFLIIQAVKFYAFLLADDLNF